jgi:hypothetical protein
MRVSVVSHTYVVEANRGKIAALREQCGASCQLIFPDRWTDTLTDVQIDRSGEQETVAPVPARFVGHGAWYWMSPRAVYTAAKRFGPELLHLEEEPYALTAWCCARVAARLGVPLTLFTWDNLGRRQPPPFEAVRRWVLARTAHVIAGNTDAALLLRQRGYEGPITVLPQLGVSTAAGPVRRTACEPMCVGYVGRLVPEKGISTVLEALSAVDGITLRIVGKGPDEARLRHEVQALGVASRVTFAGSVSHRRVAEELAKIDVLVLPSLTTPRWKEQFGHVLVEAMACGVTVVGSTCGAIPEVIGDAGLVFTEGRTDDLTLALRQLRDYPELRARLGEAGRARVLAGYTNDVIARRTYAVWESVLNAKRMAEGETRRDQR